MAVNRFNQTHVSQYNPLSMDEVLAPAMIQRQREDKILEQYADTQSALGEVGAILSSEPDDSVLKQNYNNYSQQLNSAWDSIAEHGVTANSMRKAMNLRSRLSAVVSPVINAHKARSADTMLAADILSKDPTAVLEDVSQRSLDFYVQNGFTPTGVRSVSGNNITQEVAAMASVISKLQNKPELTPADIGSLQTFGLSQEEAQNMLMLVKSTSGLSFDNIEDNPVIQEIIGNVMKRNGVLDTENKLAPWMDTQGYEKLYQSALSGTYSAVGPTSYDIRDNPFAVMDAQRRAAEAQNRATEQPNLSGKGINTLNSLAVDNYDVGEMVSKEGPIALADDLVAIKGAALVDKLRDLPDTRTSLTPNYEEDYNNLKDMLSVLEGIAGTDKRAEKLRKKIDNQRASAHSAFVGGAEFAADYDEKVTRELYQEFLGFSEEINSKYNPFIEKIDTTASQLGMDRREYFDVYSNYNNQISGPKNYYTFPVIPENISKEMINGITRVMPLDKNTWTPGNTETIDVKKLRESGNLTTVNSPMGILLAVKNDKGITEYYRPTEGHDKEGIYTSQNIATILSPKPNNENSIVGGEAHNILLQTLAINNDLNKTVRHYMQQQLHSENGSRFIINQPDNIFGESQPLQIMEITYPVTSDTGEKGYVVMRGTVADGYVVDTGIFNTLDKSDDSFKNMIDYSHRFLYRITDALVPNKSTSTTD